MKNKLYLAVITLLFTFLKTAEEETWMKEIEFDGVVLKINERIFENMMKK